MSVGAFILGVVVFFSLLFLWSFSSLPEEKWQVLASVPKVKQPNGEWAGMNLTYYGFFTAFAVVVATAFGVIMLGAIHMRLAASLILAGSILGICLPAARFVARLVERRQFSFTSNGALFVGLVTAPLVIFVVNEVLRGVSLEPLPILPVLAAAAVAFAYGEGVGRLACISFGCCYGRRTDRLPTWLQPLLRPISFTFRGDTKKIAYEGRMEGIPVVPVQAMTSTLSTLADLAGTWMYFESHYAAALIATIGTTQLWRIVSEGLRADYRGGGKISAYQLMSFAMIGYVIGAISILPAQTEIRPNLSAGLSALWSPTSLLFLEALGGVVFLYYGRSKSTGSVLSIHVDWDGI